MSADPARSSSAVAWRVARKEFALFFSTPVAWLFLGFFTGLTLFIFFWVESWFARNIADVRPLFEWMPVLLIFLLPLPNMSLWFLFYKFSFFPFFSHLQSSISSFFLIYNFFSFSHFPHSFLLLQSPFFSQLFLYTFFIHIFFFFPLFLLSLLLFHFAFVFLFSLSSLMG